MAEHWAIVPAVVLGFLALTLAVGLRAGRGHAHTTAEHVVGGRSLGMLLVFFVSIGEIYSSVAFLGQPGWAYEHGVSIFSSVGIYLSLIAFWLGPRIWAAGKDAGYLTQAQFFGARFDSPFLRGIVSVAGLVALIVYICVQMMGAGYVFNVATGGKVPFWLGALLAFAVVAVYVYAGGLRAIGWVAVVKGCLMAGVGLLIVARVVGHYYGSVTEMFAQLAQRSPAHLMLPGPKGFVNYAFQSTNLITAFCAFYMWPHLFANFFSARNGDVIRRQAIFVPLYNLVALAFTLVGFAGVLVVSGIKPDTVMVEMIRRVAPLWVVALFCAGAISASMVTGAACVLAAAATAANDLIQPRFPMPDAQLRKLVQVLIFAVTAAAYGLALLEPALIVYIVLMAYAVTAQFFPAVVVTFYFPRVTSRAVIAGLLCGLATAAIFVFRLLNPPYNIHPGFLGLCVNVPVLALASMLTAKPQSILHQQQGSGR